MKSYKIEKLSDIQVLVSSIGFHSLMDELDVIAKDIAATDFEESVVLYQTNYKGSPNQLFMAKMDNGALVIEEGSFTEVTLKQIREQLANDG